MKLSFCKIRFLFLWNTFRDTRASCFDKNTKIRQNYFFIFENNSL